VYECVRVLRNEIEPAVHPTWELSLELSARMLVLSGVAKDLDEAKANCIAKLESGEALELFRRNIELQGGDTSVCDAPEKLMPEDVERFDITSDSAGFVTAVDTLAIGDAMCVLGGGRTKAEDSIDHAVGFASDLKIGDRVEPGQTIATIYCRKQEQFVAVQSKLWNAYKISPGHLEPKQLILDLIT
jgi:pyrimidine-nucleoside phosphorylase